MHQRTVQLHQSSSIDHLDPAMCGRPLPSPYQPWCCQDSFVVGAWGMRIGEWVIGDWGIGHGMLHKCHGYCGNGKGTIGQWGQWTWGTWGMGPLWGHGV
eukprot:15439764-Alexandrium_andersonii.AAC.2